MTLRLRGFHNVSDHIKYLKKLKYDLLRGKKTPLRKRDKLDNKS